MNTSDITAGLLKPQDAMHHRSSCVVAFRPPPDPNPTIPSSPSFQTLITLHQEATLDGFFHRALVRPPPDPDPNTLWTTKNDRERTHMQGQPRPPPDPGPDSCSISRQL
eukprot:6952818-Ditylum_brightwellii.AAC.1